MTTTVGSRLEPSQIEPEKVEQLLSLFEREKEPSLISKNGKKTKLPPALSQTLAELLQNMKNGSSVLLLTEDKPLTTQEAAHFLGVSRQFVVRLLEDGEIPFHKVGSHRRVTCKELITYQQKKQGLRDLSQAIDSAGLYDAEFTGSTR